MARCSRGVKPHPISVGGAYEPSGIGYPASVTDGEYAANEYVEVPRQVILSEVSVRSVALGCWFSLILADDGRLFSCGLAASGGLGHGGRRPNVVRPKQIEALQNVCVSCMAAGHSNAIAVTVGGRVYVWGDRANISPRDNVLLPTLVEALVNERVSFVAAMCERSCAVTEDGELYTWGRDGGYGTLGHGDEEAQPTPRRVEALRGCRIATVAVGELHTLVASDDASVYGFGLSSRLGFGTVSHESQLTPRRIPNLKVWLG